MTETLIVNDDGTLSNDESLKSTTSTETTVNQFEFNTQESNKITDTEDILYSTEDSSELAGFVTPRAVSSRRSLMEDKNSSLRTEKNTKVFKRKRPDTSPNVESLISACTNIGQNIKNFMNDQVATTTETNKTDYFSLSLSESFAKIRSEKKRLLLKAKILTMIAEEVDDDDDDDE